MLTIRFTLGALALSGASLALLRAEPPAAAPAPRAVPVEDLIRQLGAPDFAARERATARLSALTIAPPAELLAAAESTDPEVRKRARTVVAALKGNAARAHLPRAVAFSKTGRADLFVALSNAIPFDAKDDATWEPALALGREALERAEMHGRPRPGIKRDLNVNRAPTRCPALYPNVEKYRSAAHPRFFNVEGVYRREVPKEGTGVPALALRAAGINCVRGVADSTLVLHGDARFGTHVSETLLVTNGSVVADTISRSVVIADGDIQIANSVGNCLLVARGNITVGTGADTSAFYAGGTIQIKELEDHKFHHFNVISARDANPLKFITFFELHRVGIEAKVDAGALVLSAVKGDSVAWRAGLKAGDVVLSAAGAKPADPEALRRALRDALAVGEAKVQVRRAGATVEAKFALPE
jgi:hypothetical protein